MKGLLDKYVMPNPSNDHKPHLLHKGGALVLAYVIVIIFFVSLIQATFITSPQFTAEVLPRVLVDLANDDRADNQINTLTLNQILVKAAQLKAADMAAEQYFAHTNPYNSEKTPWYWFSQAGYAFKYAGENLAIDFNDSSAVNRAWMDSPGHRANILNANFTEVGIAVVEGIYEGHPTTYVVQMFGKPRLVAVAAPAKETTAPPAPQPVPAPIPVPTPKPETQIAGAGEVSNEETEPDTKLVTLAEDDKFIAVQEVTTGEPELISDAPSGPAVQPEAPQYSTWYQRFVSSPQKTLEYSYIALSGLILITILLMTMKEIQRHHLKHIAYGVLLLFLMIGLLATSKALIVGQVLVK